jgi:3-oxoadipate enol-lactonase
VRWRWSAVGSLPVVPFVTAADGVRIHYRTFGDPGGAPVLLLHGLANDNAGWVLQRRALGSRHWCIAVDNRGTGRSGKPHGPYRLEQLAEDAAAVVDHAGVGPVHVVGASMGGVVAQILAITRPDLVRTLVLACTSCRPDARRDELIDGWVAFAERRGMRRFVTSNLELMLGRRVLRRWRPVAHAAVWVGLRTPLHAFVGQCRAIQDVDPSWADRLGEIAAPTLVVTGAEDALTPVSDAEVLVSCLRAAQLVVIPNAAHALMFGHPRAFNRAVLGFLDRQAATPRDPAVTPP